MDIVSRLKKFMNQQNIANSQLADTCGIPRPTISQILNGRNKKISDELIGKIHQSYPSLSILWLMFGEGNMTIETNIEISERKNHSEVSFLDHHNINNELLKTGDDLFSPLPNNLSDNFSPETNNNTNENDPNTQYKPTDTDHDNYMTKRVTSIVVFYDDNTFQTFNPS